MEIHVNFTGWFGFWICLTVYMLIEGVMYMKGHETLFWSHKTVEEKQIQQKQINPLVSE